MNKIPAKYEETTKKALISAALCGPVGAFSTVADISTIAGIWGTYLYAVAKGENLQMTKETAVQICKSALLGMGGYYAGCKTATRIFSLIPFAGQVVGMGVSSVANVMFTYHFALTVCDMLTKRNAKTDFVTLARNIRTMLRGNGLMSDARCIVELMTSRKLAGLSMTQLKKLHQ